MSNESDGRPGHSKTGEELGGTCVGLSPQNVEGCGMVVEILTNPGHPSKEKQETKLARRAVRACG